MSHDDYWQAETPYLFNGVFSYYHHEPQRVVGQVHLSEERYDLSEEDAMIRMVAGRGICTYAHLRPSIEERPLYLTVALEPSPAAPDHVGTVIGGHHGAARLREIGNVQAWYYPAAGVCCLWEAFLDRHLRGTDLITDFNMRALWLGVIAWVQETFPTCQQISTPFREPLYPDHQYQTFLRMLGFEPVAPAAFGLNLTPGDEALSYSQCLRCGHIFDGEYCPRCDVLLLQRNSMNGGK